MSGPSAVDSVIVDPAHVVPSHVDALLAQELNQLSLLDRERAVEEIHGIHSLSDAEAVVQHEREALVQMQLEIGKIPFKPVYDEALRMRSQYIHDPNFLLKFLRAEDLDARKAAIRMMKFLTHSARDLYGPRILMRPIRYMDLTPSAIALMREGNVTLLPSRDSSGRMVVAVLGDIDASIHATDRLRMLFYFWQCITDDEQTQKLGAVLVLNLAEMVHSANDYEDKTVVIQLLQSIPCKYSAVHFCFPPSPMFNAIKATFVLILGKKNRTRVRFHCGSPTEMLYSLKTFGIPVDHLPDNFGRSSKQTLKNHLRWCDMLQARDNATNDGYDFEATPVVEYPRLEDCLFGKGRLIMKHPGNVGMRNILEREAHLWETATNQEKARVARKVVSEIKKGGGRFLKEHPDGWYVEVDDETARQKVSIGFRDLMKRKRTREESEKRLRELQGAPQEESAVSSQAQVLDSDTYGFLLNSSEQFAPKRRRLSSNDESTDDGANGCFCSTPRVKG